MEYETIEQANGCQQPSEERRAYLRGLLVYFPDLRYVANHPDHSEREKELEKLLQPGDLEIIAGIPVEEVKATFEKVSQRFATDFPVGF